MEIQIIPPNAIAPRPPDLTLALACAAHLRLVRAAPRKVATYRYWCLDLCERLGPDALLQDLDLPALLAWSNDCHAKGNSPATIKAKMCMVNGLFDTARNSLHYGGLRPSIPYPRVPKAPKWWLRPDLMEEAISWCITHSENDLLDLIVWTVETGLRIEETLRCTSQHFIALKTEKPELSVPGTKNEQAAATIAISRVAASLALRRLASSPTLFEPTSYHTLARRWRRCRRALGVQDHTATLKAMRRAFARRLSGKGCPLPVLQQMMRHASHETTLEYLRLTGGAYSMEEQRAYL